MNYNLRTAALIAAGIVSAGSVVQAEESKNPVETALTSTMISGYVSTSAFFDLGEDDGGSGSRLPGRSFDGADKLDKINLDVVKLTIEKPLDEGDWSAGYKVDVLFGPDGRTLNTSSLTMGSDADSDFAIKQAYVTLQTPVGNDLIAKVGVFDTVIGYEVFESGNNPNYSRSYGYSIEPTQHTGLLLSYQIAEGIALSGGIADSWNARINAPGAEAGVDRDFGLQTYLGSLSLTAPDSWGALKGATLYAGVVHGLGSAEIGDADPRTSFYAGLTVPTPLTGLGVGAAIDYRTVEITDTDTDYAAAFAAYLTYQFSEQLKLGLRGEYAQGSNGTWGAPSPDGEELFGVTATLDYGLWANVLTRLEFRWDKDLSDGAGGFGTAASPEDNAVVLGLNILYKF